MVAKDMAVQCRRSFRMDITPSKSVRRRLDFGDERPDEAEIILELKDQAKLIDEEKKRMWNFDFESEEPLEGNWLWERCCGPVESARNDCKDEESTHDRDLENSDSLIESTPSPLSTTSTTSRKLSVVPCLDNSFFSQVERTPSISTNKKPNICQKKITDMLKIRKRKLVTSIQQSSKDNKKPSIDKNAS